MSHIEFLELVGMSINLSERQLFAQPIALAFIRRFIDRMIKPPILVCKSVMTAILKSP